MDYLLTHFHHTSPRNGAWIAIPHLTRRVSSEHKFFLNGLEHLARTRENVEDSVIKGRFIQLKEPVEYDQTKLVWLHPNSGEVILSPKKPFEDKQIIGHMPLISVTHHSKMRTIDPTKYSCDFICQREDKPHFYMCAGEYIGNVVSDLEHVDKDEIIKLEQEGKIIPVQGKPEMAYNETVYFDENGEMVIASTSGIGVNQTKF